DGSAPAAVGVEEGCAEALLDAAEAVVRSRRPGAARDGAGSGGDTSEVAQATAA
ncbi:hypothetical protein E2562_017070, partial [Oryza meyeriana var. granulata]